MTDLFARPQMPKWQNYTLWGFQGLLALAFIAAGGQKLLSTQPMTDLFSEIGAGQAFRWLTGGLEIIAACLLLIPGRALWGAALAGCIMVGAVFTHIALIGGSFVPALVLLILSVLIMWGRKPS